MFRSVLCRIKTISFRSRFTHTVGWMRGFQSCVPDRAPFYGYIGTDPDRPLKSLMTRLAISSARMHGRADRQKYRDMTSNTECSSHLSRIADLLFQQLDLRTAFIRRRRLHPTNTRKIHVTIKIIVNV